MSGHDHRGPLCVVTRLVELELPAGVAVAKRYRFGFDRSDNCGIWRPYLQAWSFRTSGVAGTRRNLSISFRDQFDTPAGTTPALQAAALATDDRWTIYQSAGVRIVAYSPPDGRGIPFPIDDGGPFDLWVGSSSDPDAGTFRAQVGWIDQRYAPSPGRVCG